ncbi:chemotaxis protein CheB [Spirosoma pollinicola]|uniref:Chemotaxis protein CheR n=1 Tax=Spirosoma pollinicola TaxID=2057025 RepID=A0A2K8YZG3_9BACT|nr:chemotaxis protein CheB [Spirosoma pollinicola]AUD02964.1 chemotaxis protein CheR [Spirosoma pollinicola]
MSSQARKPPVPIVAIGASAGGLEAISDLLQHLSPTTGLAYVYIQHLSPTHQSQLSEILGQRTEMSVREAKHRMKVEANHVYIIPPDQDMEVVDGILKLVPRRPEPAIHLPIDQFFVSLAEHQRTASIAIVLSGTAKDGTLGLKAIKGAGGITFAQDDSAKFQGMPKSAQAEGVVDKVLSPSEIAKELEWLSRQPSLFTQTALAEIQEDTQLQTETGSDSEDLNVLLQLLRKIIGIDFTHYKTATIRRRVVRRMALYKLPALPDYTDYLRQHPAEAGLLYNDLLINVTSFFRDSETMDYLGKVVLPQIIQAKQAKEPFRLWVTACSTGEEVYSLAILLMEAIDEQEKPIPVQIFATDLSERVIDKARLGRYTATQLAGVSPKRLNRFFSQEEEDYRISKVIRDLCVFAPHNVFVDPPFSRIDFISCRNLLIYTDNFLQRKAIATFHYSLNAMGYLLLGKAETVGASTNLFTQAAKNHKLYTRKNNGNRSVMPMVSHLNDGLGTSSIQSNTLSIKDIHKKSNPVPHGLRIHSSQEADDEQRITHNRTMQTPGQPDDLDQRVDELLKRYTPASVVVNKDMEILRFRGSTSLFLEPAPGKANFNLLKMARPELVFDLRNAVSKAMKSDQAISKTGLQMQVRGQNYQVTINAVPFQSLTLESFILVLFEEVVPTVLPVTAPAQLRNQRIKELEAELATMRDDMRSMLEEQEAGREELQSANEEIISSNEELQSINEELETSKEEIQSNNEELQTINQELQLSNDQLSEAYDYSDAIFGTIRETVLVLDKDLRVRTANRAFYKTFRIEPDETVGRLLYELGNRQWDILALRTLLDQVIEHNMPIQGYEMNHSFAELGDKVLRLNARKVIRLQGQAAILLAIEDITDHKQVQRLLEFLQSIITHAPVSIQLFKAARNERNTIIDFQLVPLASELGQREVQTVEELYKTSYKALYNDTQQSSLFSRYVQVVESGEPLQTELPYGEKGDSGWHLISANKFDDGFLLVSSDISDRKKAEEADAQRENQLRRLLENTPDVITRWDKNRQLVYANAAFEGRIGKATPLILGQTFLAMGQPESIAMPYMASLQEVLESGLPKEHYNVFPSPEGTIFFHTQMVPELGADGSVEGVLAIARDITQLNEAANLKQAYETILKAALDRKAQSERLQFILDSSQAAILTLTPVYSDESGEESNRLIDFRFEMVNQALATFIGQPASVLPGTRISHWFPIDLQGDTLLQNCIQTYLTGQIHRIEWHYPSQDRDKWFDMVISKVNDELLITFTDFTELKHLQQQLEKSITDLQRSNASLEQFAYVASHDLQEPLRKIQQFGTIIQANYAPNLGEDGADLISRMHSAASRLQVMIRDVLAYSRLSGKREIFIPVDLNIVVNEVITDLETTVADQKAVVQVDLLPTINGDKAQLRQLFQNLISNALKFVTTDRVPAVIVSSRLVVGYEAGMVLSPSDENKRFALIDVTDNGIGFSPDQAELIFQAFQRLHGKTAFAGTGIGLAIVQKVVENHKGYIVAEGRPGEGATFRVLLPVDV